MNKKRIFLIACVILLLFINVYCIVNNFYILKKPQLHENNTCTTSLNQLNYEIVSKTICSESSTDMVSFHIPQLQSTEFKVLNINYLIYNQVCSYISRFDICDLYLNDENVDFDWEHNKYERAAIEGDYNVAFRNKDKLSVVFNGLINRKKWSHPTNFSFSININLKTEKVINIQSLYDFNEEFIELFYSKKEMWILRLEQKEVIKAYLDLQCINELFVREDTSFYFTDGKLGIIFSGLPYAVGNYCVFEIPYTDINQFCITHNTGDGSLC